MQKNDTLSMQLAFRSVLSIHCCCNLAINDMTSRRAFQEQCFAYKRCLAATCYMAKRQAETDLSFKTLLTGEPPYV